MLMAGSLLMMLPVIAIFFSPNATFSRYYIDGNEGIIESLLP